MMHTATAPAARLSLAQAHHDADAERAAAVARPRTSRRTQGTGVYQVTVLGTVIGEVRKVEASRTTYWNAVDTNGVEVGPTFDTLSGGRRADAVAYLARTDAGVEAYRDGAIIGAAGDAEQGRVRHQLDQRVAEAEGFGDLPAHELRAARNAARPSTAEIMARVTGSVGATVTESVRAVDGTVTETARETWTRPAVAAPHCDPADGGCGAKVGESCEVGCPSRATDEYAETFGDD